MFAVSAYQPSSVELIHHTLAMIVERLSQNTCAHTYRSDGRESVRL
jgi:hypothetical protein